MSCKGGEGERRASARGGRVGSALGSVSEQSSVLCSQSSPYQASLEQRGDELFLLRALSGNSLPGLALQK